MPADSAWSDLIATGSARSRLDDNFVKPFRIVDLYIADDTDFIYRFMAVLQKFNPWKPAESTWMCYQGNIKPDESRDDVLEDLDSIYMEPLVDKQPWTNTELYECEGVQGRDEFWRVVEDSLQAWTPAQRAHVRGLQLHISAFHDDNVNAFKHGTWAAKSFQHLPHVQNVGVTYWAQLAGAEAKARTAAIRFGEQLIERTNMQLLVEQEVAEFASDYKYSVKRAMMRMVGSVERVGEVRTRLSLAGS